VSCSLSMPYTRDRRPIVERLPTSLASFATKVACQGQIKFGTASMYATPHRISQRFDQWHSSCLSDFERRSTTSSNPFKLSAFQTTLSTSLVRTESRLIPLGPITAVQRARWMAGSGHPVCIGCAHAWGHRGLPFQTHAVELRGKLCTS
jgi:hypothetical protein